ncbi:MAG: helix-turn-helix domain-containing protein [Oligoflexales bacterium]
MAKIFDNRISEKFVTAAELAKTLGVSIHTIRKWRMHERIPYHKFGRSLRFQVSEVLTAIKGVENK